MDFPALLTACAELVFPPKCQVCDRFCRSPLCQACADSFERIVPPLCEQCGRPFDPNARARAVCAACTNRRGLLDEARSFGLHVGALRESVNALKFRGRTRLARPLGQLLGVLVSRGSPDAHQLSRNDLTHIIPVPLHPSRRRARGFDQAELLATALADTVGLPVRTGLLVRVRDTRPQIGLSPAERQANVRGAFELRYPFPAPGVRALLVDDVYTTGATLRACARALRDAKAQAVYAATVSRAAPEWHPAADLIQEP